MKLHELPFNVYLNVVADVYGIDQDKIIGKSRSKKSGILHARHMLVHVLRKQAYMTYKEIGKELSMCHANAIYIGKKMDNLIEIYEDVKKSRDQVLEKLNFVAENVNNNL